MQGTFLDIGMNRNASFGACNGNGAIPATYHRHELTGAPPTGTNLAETYDYGHNGWATGAPVFMGDYTYPGSPFEGWEIQIGTARSQAFQNCGGTFTNVGGATMTGNHTAYSSAGGVARGVWDGTFTSAGGNLAIRQTTAVEVSGSAVIVTTVLRNTGAAATGNVYYMRSCDPDNDQTWPGGGFWTTNQIVHQNEDARHRVLVSSRGATGAASYMSLGTKDCRARCCIYDSWPMTSAAPLDQLWAGTYTPASITYGPIGATRDNDIAIALTYNLGSIPAGDSTIISYAYIFNGNLGIDSAFPDPQIVVNGVPKISWAPPTPNYDTFDFCQFPGLTSIPVSILNATTKNWSWSKWTWSPGLGLSATTGTNVTISTPGLPTSITYTITGTDSATGMYSCHKKVFYLTILTCNRAEANSPCEGDTLWVNAPGDSTGATYQWYGPAPYSATPFATTQKTFRFPATAGMSGTYRVIKTVAGVPDTSYVAVTIRHKPVVSATSNAPLCIGAANTLSLTATCDSPGVTYSWSRTPPSFSSSSPTPTISGFTVSDTGVYRVIVTSWFGCKDTASTHVTLVPLPSPPVVTAVTPYCVGDAFVPFAVSGLVTPGGSVLWYTSPTGGVGSATAPVINTAIAGTYKVYFSQIVGSCESLRDSVTVVVNPAPAAIGGTTGVCQYHTTTLSDATSGGTWTSSNPAIASIGSSTGIVTGHLPGTVTISYTLPTSCRTTTIVTVHGKPLPPVVPEVRPCQFKPVGVLSVTVTGPGYTTTWYGPGVTPPLSFPGGTSSIMPSTDSAGVTTYYVTQTSPFGCVSDSAAFPVRIVPEPHMPIPHDTSYCQHDPLVAPVLAFGDSLRWYTSLTAPAGTGSFTAPVPSVENPGVTTYYVTQEITGCESPKVPVNVTVLYKPEFKIIPERDWVCQFDSLTFTNTAPAGMVDPGYVWQLPVGSAFVNGTNATDPSIEARFDTVWGRHDIFLTISTYRGRCATTEMATVKVIPAPDAHLYIKPDVCLGDTISLALNSHSDNSYSYIWTVDGQPMKTAPGIKIITANVNSGGPYLISWVDSGLHIFNVVGITKEGCIAEPTADTIKVHTLPDPRFSISQIPTKFCVEDSVLFTANVKDYAYNYKWEPEHSFSNQNKPEIWGRVEQLRSKVSLTVTDAFGCHATYSKQMNPDECCTVNMPNAFTPNGDGKNDRYRPIFDGYRRFHVFRVTNRWGQTVFESANSEPSWDGTFNGVPQDMGTYFFYLKYDCGGKTQETKGDVLLVR
ncbi:hypothetical protein GCM10023093_12950 [Nemorincola caseinilytica]|uniref:Ig-like domain-containing protein n=1 Tax=Nemorincola caseinilytica TaxID=2054315 RepID=A0ABP8NDT3_9BACT